MKQAMIQIGSRCRYHALCLESSILKAWESTVKELEKTWTEQIANNHIHYNFIDTVLYALQIKGNKIDRELELWAEKFEKILSGSISDFEREVRSLVSKEKQNWMDEEKFVVKSLSDEDLRIYQALLTNLLGKMQAERVDEDSFREKELFDSIGSFVFKSDFSIDSEELAHRINSLSITPLLALMVEPNEPLLFIERIKTKPERFLAETKDNMVKRLNIEGNVYIREKCAVYEERSKRIQRWFDDAAVEQID